MTITIQRLNEANAGLLSAIAPEVFDHAIVPEHLQAFLSDPRHVMVLAVDQQAEEQIVVGMASAVEYFHPDKPPQLWINEIGVALTYRNQGIGRRLTQALIEVAKERQCIYAWLGTDADNKPAQACFSSVPEVEDPQPFLLYEWDFKA